MNRFIAIAAALCAFFWMLRGAQAAGSKPPPPAYVIPFASDDAEENAEAFSGAFRARVRAAGGWSLGEASDTLELYTTALRCPERPDAACLDRIGAQLKTDRFFWGSLKRTVKGQVLAEIHLWRKSKGDSSTTEGFSDNLRDQNDEVLRRIAGHAFAKLAGEIVPALLTVNVRPPETDAVVLVDGADSAPTDQGQATIELKPGAHVIGVRANGYKTAQNRVSIDPGKELVLDVKLERGNDDLAPAAKPIPARKILALGALVAAGGFVVAGVVETSSFLSLQSQNSNDSKAVRTLDFCDGGHPTQCATLKSAKTARALSVVFYGVAAVLAGTGVVLLVTGQSNDEAARPPEKKSAWRILPDVGPHGGSVDFALAF
ncbi:MAG: carboxypeptidase-like regulatory domain-containing protein [Polyangiaceae bacterium]